MTNMKVKMKSVVNASNSFSLKNVQQKNVDYCTAN